ncbi:LexA family protein [Veillonella montpellierensis]|uniref:LexA family protein n=1 Tax=Veillonella montpellierensis TaxID=187328 RepID=UPI00068B2065
MTTDFKKVFAKNLSNLLSINKKTQTDLVNDLKLNKSTVSTWINATKMPRMNKVEQLASYFGVEKSDLIEDSSLSRHAVSTDTINFHPRVGVKIPILGEVVAGTPISAIEDILGYEEITPEMAATGDYFCLKVKGASMEPQLFEGDILVIRQQLDVDSNEIAVVLVNGDEATVKQIKKATSGITLIGYNVAVYPPRFYSNQEIQDLPVTIVGKVVELRRPF